MPKDTGLLDTFSCYLCTQINPVPTRTFVHQQVYTITQLRQALTRIRIAHESEIVREVFYNSIDSFFPEPITLSGPFMTIKVMTSYRTS